VPTDQHIEGGGHAEHDLVGLYEAYKSQYTDITSVQMKVYAETGQYVINRGTTNNWSVSVDGSGNPYTDTWWEGLIFYAQWNRGLYQMMAQSYLDAGMPSGGYAHKTAAHILYMKHWMYTHTFSGNYRITNRNSDQSVNVFGGQTTDGAKIIQWPYGGGINEKWNMVDLGGGYYWFKNVKSAKAAVIEGASTANGALAIQWGFGGSSLNDVWRLDDVGGGYYRFVNQESGKVLEVPANSTTNGTQLDQWSWNGGNNQQFQIISVP